MNKLTEIARRLNQNPTNVRNKLMRNNWSLNNDEDVLKLVKSYTETLKSPNREKAVDLLKELGGVPEYNDLSDVIELAQVEEPVERTVPKEEPKEKIKEEPKKEIARKPHLTMRIASNDDFRAVLYLCAVGMNAFFGAHLVNDAATTVDKVLPWVACWFFAIIFELISFTVVFSTEDNFIVSDRFKNNKRSRTFLSKKSLWIIFFAFISWFSSAIYFELDLLVNPYSFDQLTKFVASLMSPAMTLAFSHLIIKQKNEV